MFIAFLFLNSIQQKLNFHQFRRKTESIIYIITQPKSEYLNYDSELPIREVRTLLKLRRHIHSNGIDWDMLELEKFFFASNLYSIVTVLKDAIENDREYFPRGKCSFITECVTIIMYEIRLFVLFMVEMKILNYFVFL